MLTYALLAICSIRSASVLICSPEARLILSKRNCAYVCGCGHQQSFAILRNKLASSFLFQVVSVNTTVLQVLLRLFVS